MKTKKKRKSLFKFYILQFAIFALVVLSIVCLTNVVIASYVIQKYPNIHSMTKYKSLLQSESYAQIPTKQIRGCIYLIFDEAGKTKYSYVDPDAPKELSQLIQTESIAEQQENFAFLNNQRVFQYHFLTDNKEERVLLFIAPAFSISEQISTIRSASFMWIFSIAFLLFLLYLQIQYCLRDLRKNTKPFQEAIQAIKTNQPLKIDAANIPKELDTLAEDLVELDKQLKNSEKEKNAEKEKRDRIIANISHDLKSPLTSIQGYAKAFCDHVVPPEQQDEYMQLIYKKSLLSSTLIRSLFDYAKMEHPDFRLNFEKLDFIELVREFISERYLEFEIRHFEFDIHFPDKMVYANVDKALMRRAFYNLSENCLSYNLDGTRIYLKIQETDTEILLYLADSGNGIPDKIRANLFDDFVVDKEKVYSHEQTGFGFPIVKKILELHNGSISLVDSSKSAFKTAFQITLPKA